jgi:hypothetical protein
LPAATIAELRAAIERGPRVPSEPAVPRRIRDAILAGLRDDPSQRVQSMPLLLRALEHDPQRARVAIAVAATLAVGGFGVHALVTSRAGSPPLSTCGDRADALVRAVWGPAQRTAVRTGFSRSASPLAADAVTRVERVRTRRPRRHPGADPPRARVDRSRCTRGRRPRERARAGETGLASGASCPAAAWPGGVEPGCLVRDRA